MTREELGQYIMPQWNGAFAEEGGEFLNLVVPRANFREKMLGLKKDNALLFDSLYCLTCVDYKTHFTMVYHLLSTQFRHSLVIKSTLEDRLNPTIDSVESIWKTAEFHEREVFDLFGVTFNGHPDLRRLLLEEDWDGFPLRKDYTDKNMVSL